MKQTKETVYRCDHCNRAMVSKGFMTTHERICKRNPNNRHKCFEYCNHLQKTEIKGWDERWEQERNFTEFRCAKQPNILLYSYKLERYKSKASRLIGMVRMPLKCDLFDNIHDCSF